MSENSTPLTDANTTAPTNPAASIEVILSYSGTQETITLNSANGWGTNLNKELRAADDSGNPITYSLSAVSKTDEYIQTVNRLKKEETETQVAKAEKTIKELIYEDVLKGNKNAILERVKEAVAKGEEASVLLNDVLIPAINQVGDFFDKQKYFLHSILFFCDTILPDGVDVHTHKV